jgi:hypothetical protein
MTAMTPRRVKKLAQKHHPETESGQDIRHLKVNTPGCHGGRTRGLQRLDPPEWGH